uniref:Uncharacterized protein n=1 Tax=Meleagris gallopavo TaxID=9103 RepID=A0A803YRX1_MELGA
ERLTAVCILLLLNVLWVTCDFSSTFSRIPAGGLIMIAQKLAGETLQEKRNRERREQYEQKLAEWQSRLSVTEDLGKMDSNELLSLPQISVVSSYKVF